MELECICLVVEIEIVNSEVFDFVDGGVMSLGRREDVWRSGEVALADLTYFARFSGLLLYHSVKYIEIGIDKRL